MRKFTSQRVPVILKTTKILAAILLLVLCHFQSRAQHVLSTTPPLSQNNGSGGITFNVHALHDIEISEIHNVFNEFNQSYKIWFSRDSINGAPFISTYSGWVMHQSGVVVGNGSSPVAVSLTKPIIIRAGETFGFYIEANTRFMTASGLATQFMDNHLRINTGSGVGYAGSLSPITADRQFVGRIAYNVLPRSANDAGITSMVTSLLCTGNQNLEVTLRNMGYNQINSVQVNWSVNGAVQTPVSVNSPIDTFGGSGSHLLNVVAGSLNLVAGQVYDLAFWTSSPNGNTDQDQSNDTLRTQIRAGLSGNYTVGGTTPDFNTLAQAIQVLHTNGVCGPVTFTVRKGTYQEQMFFEPVPGASASNPIIFEGENRDSVIIRHIGSSGNAAAIYLKGTQYLTLRNFTIATPGTANAVGIQLMNNTRNCIVENNLFLLDSTGNSTSSTTSGIVSSSSLTSTTSYGQNASDFLIRNNTIIGGYYGIRLNGVSTSVFTSGIDLVNNIIRKPYYTGIYAIYQSNGNIDGNTVSGATYDYGYYNIYLSNCADMNIRGNRIPEMVSYGIYLTAMNRNFGTRTEISNNIIGRANIGTGTPYGLYCSNVFNTDILHNTIATNSGIPLYIPTSSSTSSGNLRVRNNILANASGVTLSTGSISVFSELDYNLYYTPTVNLVTIGSGIANLNTLKSMYPQFNQGSVSQVPNFISTTDLHLTNTSAPGGPSVGITTDFDGDPRCLVFPTIGADESVFVITSPSAGFTVPDTIWQNSPATILNDATAADNESHKWYLDGVLLSTNMDLHFVFPDTGVHQLRVVSENCAGKDSFETSIRIYIPSSSPDAEFTASKVNPEVFFEEIQLLDLSNRGATSWEWKITPEVYYDPIVMMDIPTYSWGANSDETSQNPLVSFIKDGFYTVCLISSNGTGADTICKTDYIEARASVTMCTYQNAQGASGVLYDDGGVSDYSSSVDCDLLINPCASEVTLNIMEFDLKTSDFLRIYDGEDSLGTPLWNHIAYPNGMTGLYSSAAVIKTPMVAKSGKVFVQFVTNASTVGTGFRIEWTSIPLTASPITADFFTPTSLCEDNPATFENRSTGQNLNYRWLINGVLTYTEPNMTHEFTDPGTYEVTMIAENCSGVDTFKQSVLVTTPNIAPSAQFGINTQKANLNEVVTLFDSTLECLSNRTWTITPATFVFVNGTDEHSRNPQIRFTDTGCYSIDLLVENTIGQSNLTKACYVQVISFCLPEVSNLSSGIGIARVALANLDNSSATGNQAYTDYSSTYAVTLVAGASYPVRISQSTASNPVSRAVWIDFNQDGAFEPSERVAFSSNSTTQTWIGNIQVPANATLGITLMRVGLNFSNLSLQPCGSHAFGEFEDYRVNIITDTEKPIITLIGTDTLYLEKGKTYNDPGVTALDNVDGDISSLVQISGLVDASVEGVYELKYNVGDNAGNAATEVGRVVIVTPDVTAPELVLIGQNPYRIPVYDTYTEEGASAHDLADGNLTSAVIITGSVDTAMLGTYLITYTVTDAAGNISTLDREVVVFDAIAPELTLIGTDSIFLSVYSAYTEDGCLATDNYDQNVTVFVTGIVNTNRIGTYLLEYCAEDQSGNRTCIVRKVVVADTTGPVLTLLGNNPDTVARWQNYTDGGYDVVDNYDQLANVIIGGDQVITHIPGEYIITYVAVDQSGNRSDTLERVVRVVENPLLGFGPETETGIRIYPNPGNGLFQIEMEGQTSGNIRLSVTTIQGQEIREVYEGPANARNYAFDLRGEAPGIYLVHYRSEKGIATFKVVLR